MVTGTTTQKRSWSINTKVVAIAFKYWQQKAFPQKRLSQILFDMFKACGDAEHAEYCQYGKVICPRCDADEAFEKSRRFLDQNPYL